MTATTNPAGASSIPGWRLVAAETRKSINTRGSRWFLTIVLGIVAITVLVQALAIDTGSHDLGTFTTMANAVFGIFLPIIPILLISQEWSRRTALITFGLEPRRWRVLGAKFAATVIVVLAMLLAGLLAAVIGAGLAAGVRGAEVSWSLSAGTVRNLLIGNLLAAVLGFAFAALLRQAAVAIVLMFLYIFTVPTLLAVAAAQLSWFEPIRPWLDFSTAQEPLLSAGALTGTQWAHLGISSLVWLVLPLALGLWRMMRTEIK